MAEQLLKNGCVDEAIAAEVSLDGYLREQDWSQLRGEDVQVDWRDNEHCVVALLFGRRHRGESVKTGQEQGVKLESPLLSRLMAERAADAESDELIFATNPEKFRREWRRAALDLDLAWFPPPHCPRHTGPSETRAAGARHWRTSGGAADGRSPSRCRGTRSHTHSWCTERGCLRTSKPEAKFWSRASHR